MGDAASAGTEPDWVAITGRNARSVQTTIGWIFWDPGAVARYEALGLSGPLGYIAARGAPFAGAGPEAMAASFGSISPLGIVIVFTQLARPTSSGPSGRRATRPCSKAWPTHAPAILEPLADFASRSVAGGRTAPGGGATVRGQPPGGGPPDDPVLSGWQAVNYLREWRGDTHWALVAPRG